MIISGISDIIGTVSACNYNELNSEDINKGDYIKLGDLNSPVEVLRVDHKVNSILSVGTTSYSLMTINDKNQVIALISSQKVLDKVKSGMTHELKGRLVQPDYDIVNEMNSYLQKNDCIGISQIMMPLYLDTEVTERAVLRIVSGLIGIGLIVYMILLYLYIISKIKNSEHQDVMSEMADIFKFIRSKILLIVMIASVIIEIFLMFMRGYLIFP